MRLTILGGTMAIMGRLYGPSPAVSIGDGVEIRASGGRKGLGAFATRDLPADTFLGSYTGKLLSEDAAADALQRGDTTGAYFAPLQSLHTPVVLDAEDAKTSGWPVRS